MAYNDNNPWVALLSGLQTGYAQEQARRRQKQAEAKEQTRYDEQMRMAEAVRTWEQGYKEKALAQELSQGDLDRAQKSELAREQWLQNSITAADLAARGYTLPGITVPEQLPALPERRLTPAPGWLPPAVPALARFGGKLLPTVSLPGPEPDMERRLPLDVWKILSSEQAAQNAEAARAATAELLAHQRREAAAQTAQYQQGMLGLRKEELELRHKEVLAKYPSPGDQEAISKGLSAAYAGGKGTPRQRFLMAILELPISFPALKESLGLLPDDPTPLAAARTREIEELLAGRANLMEAQAEGLRSGTLRAGLPTVQQTFEGGTVDWPGGLFPGLEPLPVVPPVPARAGKVSPPLLARPPVPGTAGIGVRGLGAPKRGDDKDPYGELKTPGEKIQKVFKDHVGYLPTRYRVDVNAAPVTDSKGQSVQPLAIDPKTGQPIEEQFVPPGRQTVSYNGQTYAFQKPISRELFSRLQRWIDQEKRPYSVQFVDLYRQSVRQGVRPPMPWVVDALNAVAEKDGVQAAVQGFEQSELKLPSGIAETVNALPRGQHAKGAQLARRALALGIFGNKEKGIQPKRGAELIRFVNEQVRTAHLKKDLSNAPRP